MKVKEGRISRGRLQDEIEMNGFRRGRSIQQTIDKAKNVTKLTRERLCVLITLDVRYVFNTPTCISAYLTKICAEYSSKR